MCQSGETLLALVDQELWPVDQALVDLLKGLGVVLRQLYALPELGWHVCALDGLHVEIEGSGVWVGADGGIAGVGEGAGLPVAEASDVVLIATEVLLLGGPGRAVRFRLCDLTARLERT